MKKLIFFLAGTMTALAAGATIITVDNNPNSAADYTDLQTAINAANPGDTIYISGSETRYGTIFFDIPKQIVLIGSGINIEDPSEVTTQLNGIKFTDVAASGTVILNLRFGGIQGQNSVDGVTDIIIRRCRIEGAITLNPGYNNWLIENNIAAGFSISQRSSTTPFPADIVIRNNIFLEAGAGAIKFFLSSTVFIFNNLFLGQNESPLDIMKNSQIKNNIFYFTSIVGGGNFGTTKEESVIRNNLTNINNASVTNQIYGGPGDDGTNITADPLFTNGDNFFSFASDYRLQPGSPALTASATGGEIGIFGGVAPFPIDIASSFLSNPGHVLPVITDMEILSSDVPLDGTVEVQIKAKISN